MRYRLPLLVAVAVLAVLGTTRDSRAQSPTPPAGEFIYVSTGTGGQILKIDATSGAVTVLAISPAPPCGSQCDFEGMVVGPDGKIYVADPNDGDVFRLDQTGQNFETVYSCSQDGCPAHPQNPIFSGSAARDLYFLDPGGDLTNDIFKVAGAGFGGPFAAPSAVITPDCATTNANAYCQLGQGAAFDAADNLVFDDVPPGVIGSVFSSQPPYGNSTVTEINSTLAGVGLALNSNTGQVFTADSSGDIWQVPSGGSPYFSFSSVQAENGPLDVPYYMAFDGTGYLFVATMQQGTDGPFNGKVWRIEPGGGTAVKIADLSGSDLGLNSDNAVGVALPPTQGETQSAGVSSAAGFFSFVWPEQCGSASFPCLYTFRIDYPAGMFPDGGTAFVTPTDATEADWAGRTPPGNPFNGTQLAPVAGQNGSGIIFSAKCLMSDNSPCPVPNPSLSYTITTTWKSSQAASQANYCTLGPGLLKADPIGSDNWINTLTDCSTVSSDPTYGTKGKTTCTSSSCLSDWANVFGIEYGLLGFKSPINNPPDVNVAKAGQTIPVKFQVVANGFPVLNLTMPPVAISVTQGGSCSGSATDLTVSDASGNSGFQDLGDGNYQFNWKTQKSMAGTCAVLQVTIGSLGVAQTAKFQFK
jgi:sugar lactone lactonase YvrE